MGNKTIKELDNTFELIHGNDLLRIEIDLLKKEAHRQASRLFEASFAYDDNLKILAKMIGGWEAAWVDYIFSIDDFHDYLEACEKVKYKPKDEIVNYFADKER